MDFENPIIKSVCSGMVFAIGIAIYTMIKLRNKDCRSDYELGLIWYYGQWLEYGAVDRQSKKERMNDNQRQELRKAELLWYEKNGVDIYISMQESPGDKELVAILTNQNAPWHVE